MSDLSRRVLARFLAQTTRLRGRAEHVVFFDDATFFPRQADAAPGQRRNDQILTQPINPPKGGSTALPMSSIPSPTKSSLGGRGSSQSMDLQKLLQLLKGMK